MEILVPVYGEKSTEALGCAARMQEIEQLMLQHK